MPERYCRAGEFVDYRQHSFLSFLLNQNESAILTEDKLQFHELCVRNKLPSPAIIAVFEPDLTDSRELRAQIETVAQNEGVFFKPRFGLRAQGVGCIGLEKSGQWQARIGGKSFEFDTWQQVFDGLSSIKQSLVFQKHLQNHPVLAGINPSVLHTIRLVTFRDGEEVHALEALLRLGKRGSLTDNISAGGIGVPIDLETNILGKGTTKNTADLPFSIHSCEPGGKEFVGLSVPFFEEAVELGKRVHEYFPEIFSLGHDIAILSDGPVIMETNHIWGDNQETFDVGHGSYRHFTDKILEIARTRKWIN
jgi:hypothetical protein